MDGSSSTKPHATNEKGEKKVIPPPPTPSGLVPLEPPLPPERMENEEEKDDDISQFKVRMRTPEYSPHQTEKDTTTPLKEGASSPEDAPQDASEKLKGGSLLGRSSENFEKRKKVGLGSTRHNFKTVHQGCCSTFGSPEIS
ncbi:uncharacterized protein LOC111025315 isoform X2 [Momordica charantia]|uniref:Uncharacterized protein LOC111025315 isoform X2 n=1 Tax=Momordica charantia TaxID=3673 RepID=A0A6J1E260_MOMCH|nr:uncharacterized protein LOC111025315 isoform X2 [Momordica charantia]